MDQFETSMKLNVLPLGSYDMLIGMEWLEQHRVVLNYFDKTFTCVNNNGETINVRGIVWKDCKSFDVTVINEENTNN